jgi:outer membrane protein assembly factor BamB
MLRADDWPQWRGLNRDGVCAETGLLQTFPAEGLKVRWRVPVGWGFGSPVVAQGRAFLHDSDMSQRPGKERIHCWDETTGKVNWTHTYDVAYEEWAFDPTQEIGPVATPIVQNGKVYCLGRQNHLFCLSVRNGDVLWKRDLVKEYEAAFSAGMPSPLIDGDLLILFIDVKTGPSMLALNRDTGREVWRSLDERLTFSSPIVVASGGKKQLIVWTQQSVTSLDPATGTTHWRKRLLTNSDYAVSTPVDHEGRLLIGGLMLQMDPDKPGARVLWPKTSAPARRIYSHTSTALFRGDLVFSAKSTGELIGVDARTGEQIWATEKVTDLRNGASIHLTPNGDSVLLYTDKGELILARLSAEGYHELGRAVVIEPTMPFGGRKVVWAPPAYANRHIFARSVRELVCTSLACISHEPH